MFTCIIISNICCITFTNMSCLQSVIYFVIYNLTFAVSSSVLSHFCIFILIAMRRLKTLNNSIVNLVLKGKYDKENRYNKLMYEEHNMAKSLRYMSITHWDIIKLAKFVNKTFALQLVLVFFKTFITTLAAIHSIVKKQTGGLIINDLFWSFSTVAEIIYMLQVCTECIQLVRHNLLISNFFLRWILFSLSCFHNFISIIMHFPAYAYA